MLLDRGTGVPGDGIQLRSHRTELSTLTIDGQQSPASSFARLVS